MVSVGFSFPKEENGRILTVFIPILTFFLLVNRETSKLSERHAAFDATRFPENQTTALAREKAASIGVKADGTELKSESWLTEASKENKPVFTRPIRQLPPCAHLQKAPKTFLVVFMGHSGSSAIMSEIEAHTQTFTGPREPVDHYEYEFNTSMALEYTRDFFQRGIAEGKVAGFKMRPNHINKAPEEWAALAKEFDTRIIWQYRENVLKQAVGEYSYKYLNDTSVIEGLRNKADVKERCKRGVGCRFKIENLDFFHHTLTDCLHSDMAISRGVHLIADGKLCVHAVPYEDYLYEREKTMGQLRRFLGLRYEETAPARYKATSDNLCEVVSNWKELCANFYGCHVWRHMFEDDRNGCTCEFSTGHVEYCDSIYRG